MGFQADYYCMVTCSTISVSGISFSISNSSSLPVTTCFYRYFMTLNCFLGRDLGVVHECKLNTLMLDYFCLLLFSLFGVIRSTAVVGITSGLFEPLNDFQFDYVRFFVDSTPSKSYSLRILPFLFVVVLDFALLAALAKLLGTKVFARALLGVSSTEVGELVSWKEMISLRRISISASRACFCLRSYRLILKSILLRSNKATFSCLLFSYIFIFSVFLYARSCDS